MLQIRVGGSGRGSSWGVRVDVNGEVKFLSKIKKIYFLGGSGLGVRGSGRGWGRVGGSGCRVDEKEESNYL